MSKRIESANYTHIGVCLSQMEEITKFTNVKSEDGEGKIDAYLGLGLELVNGENCSTLFHGLTNQIELSTHAAILGILGAADTDISEIGITTKIIVSDEYESGEIDDRETDIIPIVVHTTVDSYNIDDIDSHEVENAMKFALLIVDMYNDNTDFIGYCVTDMADKLVKEISKRVVGEGISEFIGDVAEEVADESVSELVDEDDEDDEE